MSKKISPLILIALQILAAIPYAAHSEYKMALYWVVAAVLNVCVTF